MLFCLHYYKGFVGSVKCNLGRFINHQIKMDLDYSSVKFTAVNNVFDECINILWSGNRSFYLTLLNKVFLTRKKKKKCRSDTMFAEENQTKSAETNSAMLTRIQHASD